MNQNASTAVSSAANFKAMDYATLLSLLSTRDRASLERQVLAFEKKPGLSELWSKLACVLMTLSGSIAKLAGSNAILFYIPDGKYRKQVFALNALPDGSVAVYAPNVLAEAMEGGVLSPLGTAAAGSNYRVGRSREILAVDALDGSTPNLESFCKDLTGWNRKAIRMTLPITPTEVQVAAVTRVCALAAAQWG